MKDLPEDSCQEILKYLEKKIIRIEVVAILKVYPILISQTDMKNCFAVAEVVKYLQRQLYRCFIWSLFSTYPCILSITLNKHTLSIKQKLKATRLSFLHYL